MSDTPRTDAWCELAIDADVSAVLQLAMGFERELHAVTKERDAASKQCENLTLALLSKEAGKVMEWEACERERDAAQAAAAQMREALASTKQFHVMHADGLASAPLEEWIVWKSKRNAALASDAGTGWLSPTEAETFRQGIRDREARELAAAAEADNLRSERDRFKMALVEILNLECDDVLGQAGKLAADALVP